MGAVQYNHCVLVMSFPLDVSSVINVLIQLWLGSCARVTVRYSRTIVFNGLPLPLHVNKTKVEKYRC